MCVVSNVGDFYTQKWQPMVGTLSSSIEFPVSRFEFEQLRKDVLEMKNLLIKAKEIDRKTNQPDCEKEDKIKLLKEISKLVGVSLDEVFPTKPNP